MNHHLAKRQQKGDRTTFMNAITFSTEPPAATALLDVKQEPKSS